MDADYSFIHKTLKDATRRDILRQLSNGPLTYTELMKLSNVTNTGRFNYHLKALGDLIEKMEDGKYWLTNRGRLAIQLLKKFPEKTNKAGLVPMCKAHTAAERSLDGKIQKSIFPKKHVVTATLVLIIGIALVVAVPLVRVAVEKPSVQWQQFLPGISGSSVIQTPDGGYLALGTNASIQSTDSWSEYANYTSLLIKTDASGNLIWAKTYQIEGAATTLTRIIQTIDGGYALAGETLVKTIFPDIDAEIDVTEFGIATRQFCLIKIDAVGDVQWTRIYVQARQSFNGEEANVQGYTLASFIQTSNGGYALVGSYTFLPPTDQHIWFVKCDAEGNLQWNKTINMGSAGNFAASVLQTDDGGYIIIGTNTTHGPSPSSFEIIKLDSEGNVQWYKTYGGEGAYYRAECYGGMINGDRGYILIGSVRSEGGAPHGWIIKTDAQGNMLWNRTYKRYKSQILSIVQTRKGGYVFAGTTASTATSGTDAWIVKIDNVGNIEGEISIDVNFLYGVNTPNSIIAAKEGGYVFTGAWNGTMNVGYEKFWLVKIADFNVIPSSI